MTPGRTRSFPANRPRKGGAWARVGAAACLGLGVLAGGPVRAATLDRLGPAGTRIGDVVVEDGWVEIARAIALDGAQLVASHVVARPHSTNRLLQRTRSGYWVPWDRRLESLEDNGFAPSGDEVDVKIVSEELAGTAFPVTFVVILRTTAGLAYGEFTVERR